MADTQLADLRIQLDVLVPVPWAGVEAWIAKTHPYIKTYYPQHIDDFINFTTKPEWLKISKTAVNNASAKEIEHKTNTLRAIKAKNKILSFLDGLLALPSEQDLNTPTPVQQLRQLFDRFPLIVRRLSQRRTGRPPLAMNDEYDVQYLLDGLLRVLFEDVRPEEWTPSYAGNSSRMDFLLKPERIVIETKRTRVGLADREVCDELSIDIQRYRSHQDCRTLVCFVYDPEQRISNPRVLENDLTRRQGDLDVVVLVRPS